MIDREEQLRLLSEQIAAIKEEAEAKSPFKRFQQVRCCRSTGMTLINDVWEENPHDHNDPTQHFDSRVVGWDCLGRVEVATIIYSNPHCSEWCWTDDKVQPREGYDWFADNTDDRIWQKVGSEIYFMWEEPGWESSTEFHNVGDIVKAVIEAPHINYGDWIVRYEKRSGSWITRVVNQRQMWKRDETFAARFDGARARVEAALQERAASHRPHVAISVEVDDAKILLGMQNDS